MIMLIIMIREATDNLETWSYN